MKRLPRWFVGEFFGTFLLVFFGCGSAFSALTGLGASFTRAFPPYSVTVLILQGT
jgi:glycerol uptake facilitator-like aquaporin